MFRIHHALLIGMTLLCTAGAAAAGDGDPAAGEKVFIKCKACHTVEAGTHKVGPSLHGIFGRKAATAEGFPRYSAAMKGSGIVWDEKTMSEFLKNPRSYVKGTGMVFLGLKKPADIANVLAYLKQATAAK